ncbi:MAG: phosphate regulon transcriptional regulator PhoB [Gammaproteobacteria bacterium]|nr:phosphate regulon transcriptional regulator PhoB [Gammaproteobacteria bacterium]
MTTILAVEDEPAIRDMIRHSLERENYHVLTADNVAEARRLMTEHNVDLALVDWMLPDASGLELVRYLRKQETFKHLPIVVLTARSDEQDIARGLDAGADDYVTKPFSPRELHARLRALLRRSGAGGEEDVISRGALTLNRAEHRVWVGDDTLTVGHTEFKLLEFMMDNAERVYSRAQLLDHVWGPNTYIEERTIDVHVLRLRKLLKPFQLDSMIETVRGAGYRFLSTSSSSD